MFGLGLGMLGLTGSLMEGLPPWIRFILFILLGFGLFLTAYGTYLRLGIETIIFNSTTGQFWQQTTVLGVPITETISSAKEELPWNASPGRVMRYPASVAQMYKGSSAADLVTTALLQLIAQQAVSLGQIRIQPKIGKMKTLYVFSPGKTCEETEIQGALEKKIFEVIAVSCQGQPDFTFRENQYPRTHRAALTLRDVIILTFEGKKSSPHNYLVDAIIGPEARRLNLGEIKGKTVHLLDPAPNTRGKISLDIRSVEQLHRDFWVTYPEIAKEMLMQIDLLILSEIFSTAARD